MFQDPFGVGLTILVTMVALTIIIPIIVAIYDLIKFYF